ncbi:MAG: HDOD domain-containing protein [Candidatus Acidiferrales bacterium]
MSTTLAPNMLERIRGIEVTPTIPAVLMPLMQLMKAPPENVNLDEVVRLVSYDSAVSAQCLRVASSPLFGLASPPKTVNAAVISLGLRRVESILLTCCMGKAFPVKKWVLDPSVFWKHSLGCAMVCRKFCEMLENSDEEQAYMAGLLHDIGFLVNCLVFADEFAKATELAQQEQIPLDEAELSTMGFTHCESGTALAEQWKLSAEVIQVIAHHHNVERAESAQSLVAIVHLSDLLCRLRGMGYGYYERQKLDMIGDPAWQILISEHRELQKVDLERFTFELDDAVGEISDLVSTIFGGVPARA